MLYIVIISHGEFILSQNSFI